MFVCPWGSLCHIIAKNNINTGDLQENRNNYYCNLCNWEMFILLLSLNKYYYIRVQQYITTDHGEALNMDNIYILFKKKENIT